MAGTKQCPICKQSFSSRLSFCPEHGAPLVVQRNEKKDDPLIGRVLAGRFEILDCIGKGGYGAIYRARQTSILRDVALKVIRSEHEERDDVVARFLREAQAISSLSHPNIVTIYDFGQAEDGTLFIAMELLKGRTLSKLLHEEPCLSFERSVHILTQVCDGLDAAHQAGIYHRDLKPENLMLTRLGSNPEFLKILDFGVARLEWGTTKITQEGMALGTPTYMSPQQSKGEQVDQRSDIYSLGVILFEMLSGQVPFRADTALGVLLQHCQQPIPRMPEINPRADISPAIQALIEELMAKAPQERPGSAKEVRARLLSLLDRHQPGKEPAAAEAGQSDGHAESGAAQLVSPLSAALVREPTQDSGLALTGLQEDDWSVEELASATTPKISSGELLFGPPTSDSIAQPALPGPRRARTRRALLVSFALLLAAIGLLWAGLQARQGHQGSEGEAAASLGEAGSDPRAGSPGSQRSPELVASAQTSVDAGSRGTDHGPDRDQGGGRPGAPSPSAPAPAAGPEPAVEGSAGPPPRPGADPGRVLRIVSRPGGARVYLGRKSLGRTPLDLPSPSSAMTLVLRRARYRSATLRIEARATGVREQVLRRRPPRPAPSPRPASGSTPSPSGPTRGGGGSDELDDLK